MYMFFWFFKQFYYCLRRIFKSGILLLILFFIVFLFLFFNKNVKAFTSDEQNIINQYTSTMIVNSQSYLFNGYSLSNTDHRIFMSATGKFNNQNVYYIAVGSWNVQFNYFIINQAFSAKCVWSGSHAIVVWYYDSDLNCVGMSSADIYNNNYFYLNNFTILNYFSSTTTVYGANNTTLSPQMPITPFINPYIENSASDISNWNFTQLVINGGSIPLSAFCTLHWAYGSNTYSLSLNDYKSIVNSTLIFTIPANHILYDIILRSGSTLTFEISSRQSIEGGSQVLLYELGSYTLDLTSQQETIINEDTNRELISSIYSSTQAITSSLDNQTTAINNQTEKIEKQTDAINEQTDYLQDDNINNSSIYLPQDNTNDITQDGLNGIFTTIYNAFCTGQAQDIVFPIPFTSKTISLQANYVRNMLTNSNANWVITIIEAFWWFLISRFIIKDITNKITKIKSGNIEDIESTNIKGDML